MAMTISKYQTSEDTEQCTLLKKKKNISFSPLLYAYYISDIKKHGIKSLNYPG